MMDRKRKLAVCGILVIFGVLASGLRFAPALVAQSSNAAVPAAPASALDFLQPSPQPPTPTPTEQYQDPGTPTDSPYPATDTPTDTPPLDETTQVPAPTNTPLIATSTSFPQIGTATATQRFVETDTVSPPFVRPKDNTAVPTDTPVPQIYFFPTHTEPWVQPEPATAVPLPTDPLSPEPALPSETPSPEPAATVTSSPEGTPSQAVTHITAAQPAAISTIVSPAIKDEEGVIYLPFTEIQLQLIGIAAFVILDLVLLGILFRNWNKSRRRVL